MLGSIAASGAKSEIDEGIARARADSRVKNNRENHRSISAGQADGRVSWRSRAMSLVGAFPKKRLYSRLNCDALR